MTENVVDDYGWVDAGGLDSSNYITPKILSLLKDHQARKVLDLGSGNGALCAQIAAHGHHVAGVEYDVKGVELARKAFPLISFYRYGVQDHPEELLADQGRFDAVVSTEVIEHLFSPHLLPRFAGNVLKESGLLIITTPYHGYLKNLALAIMGAWDAHLTALWHGGHIKFWSRETLSTLLNENGFEVIDFSGVGRVPYLWKSMVVVARKKPVAS